MGRGSRCVLAAGTVIFAILCIFDALEASVAGLGQEPLPAIEMVDRTAKGDRLDSLHAPAPNERLIEGCESLVSSLTDSVLARIAGRCMA
jgi:hypothetical protein